MLRILLMDCCNTLSEKLRSQGFNVEQGTAGFCSGVRQLPCQVYEKDVFIYNPSFIAQRDGKHIQDKDILDSTPEFHLRHLQGRIRRGGTFLAFVNPVSEELNGQNAAYSWIPFMPPISFTKDKLIVPNPFDDFPDSDFRFLAPIIPVNALEIPVRRKIEPPPPKIIPVTFSIFSGMPKGIS